MSGDTHKVSRSDFNTKKGQIGFLVELADGRIFSEQQVCWDEIPREPIKGIKLVHFPTGHVYMETGKMAAYYFANEATAGRFSGLAAHTAKIIGVVHPLGATEWRVDFEGIIPKRSQPKHYPTPPWRESEIRQGIG